MKSYGNLFEPIVSFQNLVNAARKAQRGKRFKKAAARFNLNLEKELLALQRELRDGSYKHGPYTDFFIHDPKRRLISAAPYRDRVVHHALCNVIEPLLDRSFIYDTYACRKGKGVHAALDRYTAFSRKNRYVLKCDIRGYFPSVDQEILLGMLRRKIRCRRTMALIKEIVGSRVDTSPAVHFPGDGLFTPLERPRGLPIGNLTSQFFGNLYLSGFDHFVKSGLKCRHYIRYVDDFVLFGDDKALLNEQKQEIETALAALRLRLHSRKCRVHRVRDGVSFLGFRMFQTHRLLAKGNVLHMRRKLKKMSAQYEQGRIGFQEVHQSIQGWIGHAAHGDTHRLRSAVLGSVAFHRG